MSSLNDLGHFDQAVWGTLNGDILLNSDVFNTSISRLGIHFDPILFFFVPLYAVWPNVIWFTLAQAVAIAFSAWPIFLFAKEVAHSSRIAFVWALAYLLNPFLLNAGAWDFHPVSLAVPFIALGMLAVERGNFKLLLICSFFILICKEHFGIMVAGFGALWWLRHKSLKKSALLALLGIIHFIAVLKFIMPHFSPTGEHLMLSQDLGHLSRYSWTGNSIGEIVKNIFSNPLYFSKIVIIDLHGGAYLVMLFLLFLGMPLMGAEFVIPGVADLAANMLSTNLMPKSVFAYHSVTLIPVLACAAIYGATRICRHIKRYSVKEVTGLVLVINLIFGYLLAPFPLPFAKNIWLPNKFFNLPDSDIKEIHALIPRNASVSAQANIGAHFSQRKEIYLYPNKIGEADFLLLRMENPSNENPLKSNENPSNFIQHFQSFPKTYISSIRNIINGNKYSIAYWNEPWLIFSKNCKNNWIEVDMAPILRKLESNWKISE